MSDKNESRYVEIVQFDSWSEADIYRSGLEACGIPANLAGPNTGGTLGMYMGAVSRVSVMVPESFAENAKKILDEMLAPGSNQDSSPEPPDAPTESPPQQER